MLVLGFGGFVFFGCLVVWLAGFCFLNWAQTFT